MGIQISGGGRRGEGARGRGMGREGVKGKLQRIVYGNGEYNRARVGSSQSAGKK